MRKMLIVRRRAETDYSGSGCSMTQDVRVVEVGGVDDADFSDRTEWRLVPLPPGYRIEGEPPPKDALSDIPF
jgi:hypothetical protein